MSAVVDGILQDAEKQREGELNTVPAGAGGLSSAQSNEPMEEAPLEDNGDWVKTPIGGFRLGTPFYGLYEQLVYETGVNDTPSGKQNSESIHEYISAAIKDDNQNRGGGKTFPHDTDTSIGGNDAINSVWQFGVDDDIVWPNFKVSERRGVPRGLGRVYAETFEKNQHILWMSFGVPKFATLEKFYKEAGDSDLSRILMDKEHSLTHKLLAIAGAGIKLAIYLPWAPLIGLTRLTSKVINALTTVNVNKYYEMVPKMQLYYKAVATILAHLTVNMGLTPNGDKDLRGQPVNFPDVVDDATANAIANSVPDILSHGADILYILSKRNKWRNKPVMSESQMDEIIGIKQDAAAAIGVLKDDDPLSYNEEAKERKVKGISSLLGVFNDTILKEYQYVGFRIEKGTDSSESVSNSTGEAEIAGKLNGAAAGAREKQFTIAHGNVSDSILGKVVTGVKDAIEGTAEALGNIVGLGNAISLVSKGSGFFDIPEVWKDSSFSKSFSFDIQLRSLYGDPLSIYQNIYIPLAMLMAGSFPIAIGNNTYTSPLLCQAFSKGLFSIPTGIIDSMTIKRGLSEHGWTYEHLPTAVDVSLSIKDLSPAMFLSIAKGQSDANPLKLFKGTDSMKAYFGTLAGLDIVQMTHKIAQLQRRAKAMLAINKATTFNPRYRAVQVSSNKLVRAGVALMPTRMHKPSRT